MEAQEKVRPYVWLLPILLVSFIVLVIFIWAVRQPLTNNVFNKPTGPNPAQASSGSATAGAAAQPNISAPGSVMNGVTGPKLDEDRNTQHVPTWPRVAHP